MNEIEKHAFKDINFFPVNMKTLILGTFPVPLYSQKEKFNLLSKDKRDNAWYYASGKSEFWRLIADSFNIDNKEFLTDKNLKKKLFENNNIGIADVFSKCKRKNKESSKDTDLIIVEYNNLLADIFENYSKSLKLIIFTSRFTENNFFKILNKNNLNYQLEESEEIREHYKNKNCINNDIINSVRERFILTKNLKVKIATITLKISPVKGVSLYSTKRELFKYYLNYNNKKYFIC